MTYGEIIKMIDEKKIYKVYKHISPDGKIYIGVSKNPYQRWKSGTGYKDSLLFDKAIKKYGWNNIQHIIAKGTYTQRRAYELEKKLIAKYKSNDKKFGYNMTAGGLGRFGLKYTEQEIKTLCDAQRKRRSENKVSEETKEKIKTARQKWVSENKVSDETKEKLSISHTGKKFSDATKAKMANSQKICWAKRKEDACKSLERRQSYC